MEASKKARELIDKFKPLVTTWDCYWDAPLPEKEIIKDAKECALICVDEILTVVLKWTTSYSELKYWEAVKEHILSY